MRAHLLVLVSFAALTGCSMTAPARHMAPGGCDTAADCDDGDADSVDACEVATRSCHHTRTEVLPSGCASNAACDDGDADSQDLCDVGRTCHHTTVERPAPPPVPDAGPVPEEDAGTDSGADAGPETCLLVHSLYDLPEAGPEAPTGVLGSYHMLLGTFRVSNLCEAMDVTQIILRDETLGGGATAADFFQNLRLEDVAGNQIGLTVGHLTDIPGSQYAFTPAPVIRVTPLTPLDVRVFVDVKAVVDADLLRINELAIGPFYFSAGRPVSITRGEAYEDGRHGMQRIWIADHGRLIVHPRADAPAGGVLAMGSANNELFRFALENGPEEELDVTRLSVFVQWTDSFPGLTNIRLRNIETGEQLGGTLASLDTAYSVAVFDSISTLRLPRNGTVTIGLYADVNPFLGGVVSGTHFGLLMNRMTFGDPGELWAVRATGHDSGRGLGPDDVRFDAPDSANIYGGWFTIYRSELSIARSSASPSGVSSGSAEQLVARFVVTNHSPGGFTSTVRVLNLDIGSTIDLSAHRLLRVYRDAVAPGNLLATWQFGPDETFGDTEWTDADFADFDISGVGYREIFVTAETSDARTGQTLTIGLDAGDLHWSDGVTADIGACDSLPVPGNTLSY